MKNNLLKYNLIGFVFVSILGTLSHFAFEWSGYSYAVAFLCPVNESTWEHLKLLFFPYLIWTVAEYYIMKKESGIIISKSIGAAAGMLAIAIFYYTYTGMWGKSIDILNILSFFIGVSVSFITDSRLIKSKKLKKSGLNALGIAIFIAIGAMFFIFTVAPPLIPLFKDPITSAYGI